MIFRKIGSFLNRIVELDKAEESENFRRRRMLVMCGGAGLLVLLCIAFSIYPLMNGFYATFATYLGIILSLGMSLVVLFWTNSTGAAATIAAYGSYVVVGVTFYFNPYPMRGGLDGFWLWLLLVPFLADYFAGLVTGFQISLGGLVMSIVYMWALRDHFIDYGGDVLTFYPMIFLVASIIAWVLQFEIVYNHRMELKAEEVEKTRQEDRLKNMEKELAAYEENMNLVNRHHHDLRHYTRVLRQLLNEGDTEEAIHYLNELDGNLENVTSMTYCDNKLINSILSIYHNRLRKNKCNMKIRAAVPEELNITDVDLSALLSNILENCAEALEKIPDEEKKFMNVKLDYENGKLKGSVVNSCVTGAMFDDNGMPVSTKRIKSGVGTKNIMNITEKYGGTVGFEEKDDTFITRFVLAC